MEVHDIVQETGIKTIPKKKKCKKAKWLSEEALQIAASRREAEEGDGTPLQYSCLENPMDGGACWATVHGVAKSRTRLSDFTSPCMKWSLAISNFLEEISSLSHFIVFVYFFALIAEEGSHFFLLFFGTLHSHGYIFPFLLCFSLLFFSLLFVRPPQTAILLFPFLFLGNGLDPCLLYNVMNLHP